MPLPFETEPPLAADDRPSAGDSTTDETPRARGSADAGAPPAAAGDRFAAELRARLRAHTRARHEALDARFGDLFGAEDEAAYRRFVAMNRTAFGVLVPLVAASPLARGPEGAGEGLSGESVADRLQAGLAAIEADALAMAVPPVAPPPFEPSRPDEAQAAGIAYVLEGSKLGARLIGRHLRASDAPARWRQASFRYLDAAAENARFGRFVADLGAEAVRGPDGLARCLDAAQSTFAFFAAILDRIEAAGPAPGTPSASRADTLLADTGHRAP